MLRGVLVLAASGCAEVPPNPVDPPNPSHVGFDAVGSRIYDARNRFELTFADSGIRFPTSLKLAPTTNPIEVFGTASCPTSSTAGMGLVPMHTATTTSTLPNEFDQAMNTLTLKDLVGPAIVQVEVKFAFPYSCNGKQQLAGTSTFTVFPSGRIVRKDEAQASQTSINTAGCSGCNGFGGGPVALETFWGLAQSGTRFDAQDNMLARGADLVTVPSACVQYATHTAAIAWQDVPPAPAETRSTDRDGTIGFAFEHFASTPDVKNTNSTVHSIFAAGLGSEACSAVIPRVKLPALNLFRDDVLTPLVLDLDDGIYKATGNWAQQRFQIKTADREAFDEGFAVRLDLDQPSHLLVASELSGALDPAKYTVQEDGEDTIVWIDEGIAAGDSIVVEVK